jgi:hypothetical protein
MPALLAINGRAETSVMSCRFFVNRFFYSRFIYKHDGNIITNRINTLALDALETAAVRLQFDFRFARRASKYIQEFLTDCHGFNLFEDESCGKCGKLITNGRHALADRLVLGEGRLLGSGQYVSDLTKGTVTTNVAPPR